MAKQEYQLICMILVFRELVPETNSDVTFFCGCQPDSFTPQNDENPGFRRGILISNIQILTSNVVEAPGLEPGSKEKSTEASTSISYTLISGFSLL